MDSVGGWVRWSGVGKEGSKISIEHSRTTPKSVGVVSRLGEGEKRGCQPENKSSGDSGSERRSRTLYQCRVTISD